MSGHSQFKNIMYRKGAQNAKRAKIFAKHIRELAAAAKGVNMPKDNIDRAAFAKHGGALGETGGVSFLFDRVGVIHFNCAAAAEDDLFETAVEAGAEGIESEPDGHDVFCSPDDWALLDLWDADITYSYIRLPEKLGNRLYSEFAPTGLKTHIELGDHNSSYGYRSDYTGDFGFVSSLSLLPFFVRRAQVGDAHVGP